jgi:hypothetical protein
MKGTGLLESRLPEVLWRASTATTPTTPPPGGADFLGGQTDPAARVRCAGLSAGRRGALPAASGLEVSEMVCTSSLCLEESRERG